LLVINSHDADQPTVLAVGAHHDDNELIAGTLAAHQRAGWRVVSAVLTNGCYIDGEVSASHVEQREEESRQAAELLGMTCDFLRIPEGRIATESDHVYALVSAIRRWRPQILIAHPPVDYHAEHEWACRLTMDAIASCWNPSIETDEPPVSPPMVYYRDAWFMPFDPDEYVDVSPYVDLKCRMLECHQSQLPPAELELDSMVDMSLIRSRQRGFEAGVKHAEAFRLAPRLGYQRLSRLLHPPSRTRRYLAPDDIASEVLPS
jgi:LmbE family N-acetylglucosaminyl deacetylase